ncbi:hypothetical protein PIROE2DRAFT_19143 [Piromyces sp. E2]|nr:hypothetical protein PIROE2DRAFT_19143 [Piromyces sp. E2]|eukprot:OUM56307.1 hypothetical protein PIROE2DRAFT_19143 [Piromyces sp. E2]
MSLKRNKNNKVKKSKEILQKRKHVSKNINPNSTSNKNIKILSKIGGMFKGNIKNQLVSSGESNMLSSGKSFILKYYFFSVKILNDKSSRLS